MSLGNMAHGRAPVFYGHPENSVITIENDRGRTLAGSVCITMSHKPNARLSSRRTPESKGNDFCFSTTVRYSRLFLTGPPNENNRVASEITQNSS